MTLRSAINMQKELTNLKVYSFVTALELAFKVTTNQMSQIIVEIELQRTGLELIELRATDDGLIDQLFKR